MLKNAVSDIKKWFSSSQALPVSLMLFTHAFLLVMMFAVGFLLGNLWTEMQYIKGGAKLAGLGAGTPPSGSAQQAQPKNYKPLPKPTKNDFIRGSESAAVALVDYSDYDCPYCTRFNATVEQLLKDYAGKIMYVRRHAVLANHPDAPKKAEAAECVNELAGKEKFWQFGDYLYTNTEALADLPEIVANLGVDKEAFSKCLTSGKYTAKFQAQNQEALAVGVQGTPGNFLMNMKNGEVTQLGGAVPVDQLKPLIDAMLAK